MSNDITWGIFYSVAFLMFGLFGGIVGYSWGIDDITITKPQIDYCLDFCQINNGVVEFKSRSCKCGNGATFVYEGK